jgi:CRP-like cAMP-binding protein
VLGGELARAALAASPLFAKFSESELLRVQKIAFAREFAAGEHIFQEGELVSSFFLTVAGGVTAWKGGIKVGHSEPGDPLGNLSMAPQVSTLSARCETPVVVLEFPVAEVQSLMTTDPVVAAKLAFAALAKASDRLASLGGILAKHRASGQIPLAE